MEVLLSNLVNKPIRVVCRDMHEVQGVLLRVSAPAGDRPALLLNMGGRGVIVNLDAVISVSEE
jgi:hypothetical protein